MSKRENSLFDAIRALTGHESRLSVERVYCEAMGRDLAGGMFLSELIFWCDKGKRVDGFFYRTAGEWEERTYLSTYLVRKYTEQCKNFGWLETKLIRANGSPTVHYRVDSVKFSKWICEFLQIGFVNFEKSLTDTTTKTTSITAIDSATRPGHASGDRDGKQLVELVRAKGFMYLDSQPTRMAMLLESDYNDGQLRIALDKTVEAHQKQIKTGKRGITAPLAYMRQILAGMDSTNTSAETTNVINLSTLMENAIE